MTSKTYKCRVLVGGDASGEPLFCREAFTFARAVDPGTGLVADLRSEMTGASIRGKVLFYRRSKGSTAGSVCLAEAIRLGNGPAAVVTERPDLAAIVGSTVAGTLYGRTVPVLSDIDTRVFARAKTEAWSIASVEGGAARVVLTV
jgi:predicted aconitase with swiveling domain